jgi:LmbE family N-acetylglucosaminyl deacetylase
MSLTFMAVHAHPDDEASSTGGVLARYADEGITTIVVTCTNGELGDLPGGIKPDHDEHDEELVVKMRTAELEKACEILNVTHLERLGYRDSGMSDWEHKGHPDAFCNVPFEKAVGKLLGLFEKYRPDVVVSYNPDSPYDHPDHVQASRITIEATKRSQIPRKQYYTAMRANRFARMRELLEEAGVELPPRQAPNPDWVRKSQELEALINATVDVTPYVDRKLEALRTHESQIQNFWWNKIPREPLDEIFGHENFVRMYDVTGVELPESDLFAGLR